MGRQLKGSITISASTDTATLGLKHRHECGTPDTTRWHGGVLEREVADLRIARSVRWNGVSKVGLDFGQAVVRARSVVGDLDQIALGRIVHNLGTDRSCWNRLTGKTRKAFLGRSVRKCGHGIGTDCRSSRRRKRDRGCHLNRRLGGALGRSSSRRLGRRFGRSSSRCLGWCFRWGLCV